MSEHTTTLNNQCPALYAPRRGMTAEDIENWLSTGAWSVVDSVYSVGADIARALPYTLFFLVERRTRTQITVKLTTGGQMAKTSKKVGDWKGFADISVGKDDKEAMAEYATKTEEVMFDLKRLVEDEYKVTLSYHTEQDVFMCSISCYDATSPNYKYTMVSRSTDTQRALVAGLYKHFHIANAKWPVSARDDLDF